MPTALSIVQKFFPDVRTVVDATKPCVVEVTKQDTKSAAVRNHKTCALAVACKRTTMADGVIISVRTAYVIFGKKAIRFKLLETTSREVVSFDRKAGFMPGIYKLCVPGIKLGYHPSTEGRSHGDRGKPAEPRHFTDGIRTTLGSGITGKAV